MFFQGFHSKTPPRSSPPEVHDVYKRCDLARDQQQPDTLQMLGAIETRIEELISGLDEAYIQAEWMGLGMDGWVGRVVCGVGGRGVVGVGESRLELE